MKETIPYVTAAVPIEEAASGSASLARGQNVGFLQSAYAPVFVLGVPFHNTSLDGAMSWIEERIASGGPHQIATANVDFVTHALHDPELHRILCECSLVLPDGMPVVWASKLLGRPLKERVTGADLVPLIAEASARHGYRIYLLGAAEPVMRRAVIQLRKTYPGVHIAGYSSPPWRPVDKMDHEEMLRGIEAAAPDILLVAFGNPKQERWLYMHRNRLRVPVMMGVGASLDMIAGAVRRAPRWMQKSGLEWLFRAGQEPRRLFPRYFRNAVMLARHLPGEILASCWLRAGSLLREKRGKRQRVEGIPASRGKGLPPTVDDPALASAQERA